MNKNRIIVLIVFFNIVVFHAQKIEGKITYLASSKKALNYIQKDDKKDKKNTRHHVNKIYKNAKNISVVLLFNNKISKYYALDKMDLSSKESINYTHIMAGGEKKYYTYNDIMGYNNNTLDCFLLGECFLIENIIPKWEFKQETKIIQGFKCYKAVLRNKNNNKINLEAWYTPKIPYQYGVLDYYGLPGLILEINKNTFTITATKIELNPLEKIKIEEPKGFKKLSYKEFKEILKKNSPFKD